MRELRGITEDEKYVLDKYTEIVKLRATLVIALFIAYSFSIRASESFFDNSSILALIIPCAAWMFDLIARWQYMCPYAYAAASYAYKNKEGKGIESAADSLPNLVLDFSVGESSKLVTLFDDENELDRRRKFKKWFTFKDQLAPAIIFSSFFIFALWSTGAFNQHLEQMDQKEKVCTEVCCQLWIQ